MKHILMATTALVTTAGIASADITLSGWAEMGMVGGNGGETEFHQDIDVTFKMSGETDGAPGFDWCWVLFWWEIVELKFK